MPSVPIRKASRDPEALDAIRLYGALQSQTNDAADLHDPARVEEFADRMRRSITRSLELPTRLHGIHDEMMFRAMVVAIGEARLIAEADAGELYFDDAGGKLQPPDYRVVDRDGEQMLIEVKRVSAGRELEAFALRGIDVAAHLRYAKLTAAPLFFALYWPGWNYWTLIPEEALSHSGSKREIDLSGALLANQMYRLGDAMVGTTPPLTLSVELDPDEKPVRPGAVTGAVTAAEMSAAGVMLEDPTETNIAWTLLRYGTWTLAEGQTLSTYAGSLRLDWVASPPLDEADETVERQGFVGIGSLSSIYSSMFNEATLTDEGTVRHLAHEPVPGVTGALIPNDYWKRKDRRLRVWRIELRPAELSRDPLSPEETERPGARRPQGSPRKTAPDIAS